MIESLINKALDGNLELVKRIVEDLDLIYFNDEDQAKIQSIRKKFKVEPSYVVHTTVDHMGASPVKYWKKSGIFVNNEERVYVEMLIQKHIHAGFIEGQILYNEQEFWWKVL